MELVERIEKFLNESTEHAIAVSKGDARLSKSTGRKFLFSLSDINSLYGSVNSFIKQLPVVALLAKLLSTCIGCAPIVSLTK